MSGVPLHRDLLTDDHMQRTGNLSRKQAGALARLKVLADQWDLPNLGSLVKETVAFGASVDGRRARDIVEVLSAQGYDGDRLDGLLAGALDDDDLDMDEVHASRGNGSGVTNRQKPSGEAKKGRRRGRLGYH